MMDDVGLAIAALLPPEYRGAYGDAVRSRWDSEGRPSMTRMKVLAVLLSAVVLAAASQGVPWASAQERRPATPSSVRLYVFDGGMLESDPARYRLTKEDVGTTRVVGGGVSDRSSERRVAVGYGRRAR